MSTDAGSPQKILPAPRRFSFGSFGAARVVLVDFLAALARPAGAAFFFCAVFDFLDDFFGAAVFFGQSFRLLRRFDLAAHRISQDCYHRSPP